MSSADAPLKIVLVGITGKTGSQIEVLARESSRFEVVAGVSRSQGPLPSVGLNSGSSIPVVVSLDDAPPHDAVIDFSSPNLTEQIAKSAASHGVALIVGTTGISPDGIAALHAAAKDIPVIYSPNMSIGVNLLFALTQKTARALSGAWNTEIFEAHHKHKKDAPSGTAVKLAQEAEAGMESAQWVHGREGDVGARKNDEIGIHAMRGGDIVGEHTVFFVGDGERIELTHRATDRKIFAQGALQAATWAKGKAPGLYSMNDVLGLD